MKITWCKTTTRVLLVSSLAIIAPQLQAESDGLYELSGRLNIVGATGEPANDMLGVGFSLRRKLNDDWYLGFNFDHAKEYDVERPNKLLGISSASETDALATMNMLTVIAERRYALESGNWTGFWNLGAGFADISVDAADGDVEGGGRFDIETDADTETVLLGGIGLMQQLGEHWSARYEVAIEHHLADWKVTDRVSGRTGSIDDYTVSGVRLGMNYRF